MGPVRRVGRPRSELARQAILASTVRLMGDAGYDALTIDAIASDAGVGRQTIYRWWSSKAAIIAEAVVSGAISPFVSELTEHSTEDLLEVWVDGFRDPGHAALVRALAAAAASDAEDSAALYDLTTRASHANLADALRRDQTAGVIRSDLAPEVTADALIGALLYRALARVEIPEDYAEQLMRPLRATPPVD